MLRNFTHKEKLPALVHCAHGKDRTGVLSALLLAACGVPDEDIIKDYARVSLADRLDAVLLAAFGGCCYVTELVLSVLFWVGSGIGGMHLWVKVGGACGGLLLLQMCAF